MRLNVSIKESDINDCFVEIHAGEWYRKSRLGDMLRRMYEMV